MNRTLLSIIAAIGLALSSTVHAMLPAAGLLALHGAAHYCNTLQNRQPSIAHIINAPDQDTQSPDKTVIFKQLENVKRYAEILTNMSSEDLRKERIIVLEVRNFLKNQDALLQNDLDRSNITERNYNFFKQKMRNLKIASIGWITLSYPALANAAYGAYSCAQGNWLNVFLSFAVNANLPNSVSPSPLVWSLATASVFLPHVWENEKKHDIIKDETNIIIVNAHQKITRLREILSFLDRTTEQITVAGLPSDTPCIICTNNIEAHSQHDDKRPTALPCGHPFHADCIQQWLALQKICPTCRYNI